MKALSSRLVAGLAHASPDDDGLFGSLETLLSDMRQRPVILKRTAFPPETASGLWVNLPDMDILAVREDTTDEGHAHVILGHEIWHMFQGHCAPHTSVGPAAARTQSGNSETVDRVARHILASDDGRLSTRAYGDLTGAARTGFDAAVEAEAELFGLRFGTDLRAVRSRTHRRPDSVAGRIEESLSRGLWA
ncbi:toxin-antitoxin system, toxin component [Streptomyces sp. NPDC051639]|uniref:toxin-antitoxin system, toxin component n=1 Tax=Streptomyces sp. NPDC051639 TaxID=3155671 RepID=UPI00344351C5